MGFHPVRPNAVTEWSDQRQVSQSQGYANLVQIATVVQQVAMAKNKRLQFHIHNGEGERNKERGG